MSSLVVIPARSAALIMEELREGFPLAGSRASAADFTAAEVSTAVGVEAFTVAGVTGNPVSFIENNLRYGEPNHARNESDNRDIFEAEVQLHGYASRSCIAGGGLLSIESRSDLGTGDLFVPVESEQRSLPGGPK